MALGGCDLGGGSDEISAPPREVAHVPLCTDSDTSDDIHVKMIYPNGGEVFHVGDTIEIIRCAEIVEDSFLGEAPTQLSWDGGRSWQTIGLELFSEGAVGEFVIPASLPVIDEETTDLVDVSIVSDRYLMRILVYTHAEDFDQSDGVFTILP